eukprot:COSAG05_NODE_8045_length_742_cov_1.209953_1_plen_204_part_01
MPAGEQTRSKSLSRRDYVLERKRPQVIWMLGLIAALGRRRLDANATAATVTNALGSSASHQRHQQLLRVVDIGGGRGDLALAIGACLGQRLASTLGEERLTTPSREGGSVGVHVVVLDINPRSLEQGAKRAADAGLLFRQRQQYAGTASDSTGKEEEGGGLGGLEFIACDVSDDDAVDRCLAQAFRGRNGGGGRCGESHLDLVT